MMKTALIISGGVAHPYAATSEIAARYLENAGFACDVSDDPNALTYRSAPDLVLFNCALFTCAHTPEWRAEWEFLLSDAAKAWIRGLTERGAGIVALHCAPICFDDFPEFYDIIGAEWRWGTSSHGPYARYRMRVSDPSHPLTGGISDFDIDDELYINLVPHGDITPLLTAEYGGEVHPMLWAKTYGASRVCYLALGHDERSFGCPQFATLLENCARWATNEI